MSTQDRSPSSWRRMPALEAEFTTYMPAAEARRRSGVEDSRGAARVQRETAVERVIGVFRNTPGLRRV